MNSATLFTKLQFIRSVSVHGVCASGEEGQTGKQKALLRRGGHSEIASPLFSQDFGHTRTCLACFSSHSVLWSTVRAQFVSDGLMNPLGAKDTGL